MIEIPNNITKAEIAKLPPVLFNGRIIVIHNLADVDPVFSITKVFNVLGQLPFTLDLCRYGGGEH